LSTQRYAALLRGVSPMNAKMSELKQCFEQAGFADVRTVLASGNVVFNAPRSSENALQRKIEQAMQDTLGRTFLTIVRPIAALERILESDPYAKAKLRPKAKRVVTFLRDAPQARSRLPIELDGASIVFMRGQEVFSAYVRSPKGPVFMRLIDKTFGDAVTTRTWDTVHKIARA
jgi:uncharacterized protein (DUF1697 family)